jgi:hypothetical protein
MVWAMDTAAINPGCWFGYMDDLFVIWPHGPHELSNFIIVSNVLEE